MKPNNRKRVACYTRVSGPGQTFEDKAFGPAIQRNAIKAFAESQGWEIIELFEDLAVTGTVLQRPALQRMIEDGKNGKFDLILVHRIDRMSRSLKELLKLVEDILEPMGIALKSVTESFVDTSTPEGKAMFQMLGSFSELDKNQLIRKLKAGRMEKHQRGGYSVGATVTGYASMDGKLVVVDQYAELVKRIFNMFVYQDIGLNKIATTLNREGIMTKNGNKWYARTVRLLLECETLTGMVKNQTIKPGIQKAIISRSLWGRAQKKLHK